METEPISWPKFYPGLKQRAYAPHWYNRVASRKHSEYDHYSGLINDLKAGQDKRQEFKPYLASLLDELSKKGILAGIDVVCVVPKHTTKEYNKTLCDLASDIAKHASIDCQAELIKRTRTVASHHTHVKTAPERFKNISGSLSVDPAQVKGKGILLFDDVKTTGITVLECTKVLNAAGATKVVSVCLGINHSAQ